MGWSDMPPLSALRAFAAYSESGSLERAGAALNVSHAAISQQLRALETHLGVPLLDRSARRMSLTAEGELLARATTDGFGQMGQVVATLRGADATRPLHVACTPGFAATWLMPRLGAFRSAHPEIELMINPNPALTDPSPGGIDIALRYGDGPWAGLDNTPLLRAPLVVVGAPSLFPDGPPEDPRALLDRPWLQELGTNEATRGMELWGISQRPSNVSHLPGNLLIEGLRDGQGIAVTTRLQVEKDLAEGRLILLYDQQDNAYYHIVTLPGVHRPPLRAFIRWLGRQAAAALAPAPNPGPPPLA
ncbi:MAG: LysR family transcriptional regulator [Pelagimonas sp.]|jgi:LysR family glycine cleavage system transcriptional activator|nr:LysR family transcriptional regulator [Pelagimonas sp.]